jgi:hypothetical protein
VRQDRDRRDHGRQRGPARHRCAGPSGRWAAFEVKLSQSQIDEAAAALRAFADRIDAKSCGHPAALAVITGNGYGYVRPDGVAVIPIGTLGP